MTRLCDGTGQEIYATTVHWAQRASGDLKRTPSRSILVVLGGMYRRPTDEYGI